MPISSRWPTAEERTYRSPSKYSSLRASPPSARAMSAATEGFSAMIRRLAIAIAYEGDEEPGREGVNDKQGPAREQGKPQSNMRDAAHAGDDCARVASRRVSAAAGRRRR